MNYFYWIKRSIPSSTQLLYWLALALVVSLIVLFVGQVNEWPESIMQSFEAHILIWSNLVMVVAMYDISKRLGFSFLAVGTGVVSFVTVAILSMLVLFIVLSGDWSAIIWSGLVWLQETAMSISKIASILLIVGLTWRLWKAR